MTGPVVSLDPTTQSRPIWRSAMSFENWPTAASGASTRDQRGSTEAALAMSAA